MCYYIASVSFGKDSLAMLLLILDDLDNGGHRYPLDEVIFFDWGMEFQAIYANRDKIKPMLAARGIKFTELKYETSFIYNFCEREVNKKTALSSVVILGAAVELDGELTVKILLLRNTIKHYPIRKLLNM